MYNRLSKFNLFSINEHVLPSSSDSLCYPNIFSIKHRGTMSKFINDIFALASSNWGKMWSHFQKCDQNISSKCNKCTYHITAWSETEQFSPFFSLLLIDFQKFQYIFHLLISINFNTQSNKIVASLKVSIQKSFKFMHRHPHCIQISKVWIISYINT